MLIKLTVYHANTLANGAAFCNNYNLVRTDLYTFSKYKGLLSLLHLKKKLHILQRDQNP